MPWFPPSPEPPGARMRLLCFPYGGGGASVFRGWGRWAPAWLSVRAVQLPGREERGGEPPMADMAALVAGLLDAYEQLTPRPTAFFGHSLGGLVAYELALALRRVGGAPPVRLYVSATPGPAVQRARPPVHALPDADFMDVIRALGGLDDPARAAKLVPLLRADFALSESLTASPEAPLDCPVTAFGGEDDALVPPADLDAWAACTAGGFTRRMLPGDHFFLRAQAPALLAAIAADLAGG